MDNVSNPVEKKHLTVADLKKLIVQADPETPILIGYQYEEGGVKYGDTGGVIEAFVTTNESAPPHLWLEVGF